MSVSLDIMSETKFTTLLKEFTTFETLDNPIDLLLKYSEHYTNFSGNLNRLYDVILEGEKITNDFSCEVDLQIFKLSKEKVINIIMNSEDSNLVEKWETIMKVFKDYNPEEKLYFIIADEITISFS